MELRLLTFYVHIHMLFCLSGELVKSSFTCECLIHKSLHHNFITLKTPKYFKQINFFPPRRN